MIEGIDKQDQVHVYFVKEDGSYTFQEGGISGLDSQPIRYRSNLFTVEEPGVEEVYIALSGKLPLMFSSVMYSNDSFLESVSSYKFSIGVFYGFMLYNLFLFLSFKEKAYFYYALYMLSLNLCSPAVIRLCMKRKKRGETE